MDYKDYQVGLNHHHFWFKAKEHLIETLLRRSSPQHKNLTILDVGAGTGNDIHILNKFGNVYVLDMDQQALDLIPNSLVVDKKLGDACNMPYPDNFFDIVVAFDVLEHMANDQRMVAEIYRTLKKDGVFIFTVPAFNFLFSAHDKTLCHYRRYNTSMMYKLLNTFNHVAHGYWMFSLFVPAALQRLCYKKANNQTTMPPSIINKICYHILRLEVWLISKGLVFPWGLTLYGVYRKPQNIH